MLFNMTHSSHTHTNTQPQRNMFPNIKVCALQLTALTSIKLLHNLITIQLYLYLVVQILRN